MLAIGKQLFTDKEIKSIIDESVSLLKDPGVRIQNQEVLECLRSFGVDIDWMNNIAHIQEDHVDQSLDSTPKSFYLFDRDGKKSVTYGGDSIAFDPGSTAVSFIDNNLGVQREPVTTDYIKSVKLVEMLPQIDAQSTAMVCADVPKEIGDFYRLYLSLCFMRKPIVTGAFRKDTLWTMFELLKTAADGEQKLRNYPLGIFDICPTPPLTWSDLACQNLIDCARMEVPVQLVSMPLAGATAPVTLAAAIVQHAAESLSGIVIHQAANPGSPIVWGGSPAGFDMRFGTTPMGAPETWLIDLGYIQVGKYLNLPTHAYMGMSDAKLVDAQCGFESMAGVLLAALSGTNMISGAGMLDYETCFSLEKLVIDAETIGMVKRVREGIIFRNSPVGLELIQEMGHKADYIRHPHTRKWFRDEFYLPSDLIDRNAYESWRQTGSKSIYDRASEHVNTLLSRYVPISEDAQYFDELHKIALSAAKNFGMEKLYRRP
jgi:trimethylamine--corrinoid protein Co-methyltransferase